MELDHLFICCDVGAPEAQRLIALGLIEGSPNTHPGQGTANRRFFFHNAFLELVWVTDPAEARSELVRRTGMWERWSWRKSGASPFGIGLRPTPGENPTPTFPTWDYRPAYLPDPLVIQMGTNSDVASEPLVFHIEFGRRADTATGTHRQPIDHALPWRSITRVRIVSPRASEPSAALRAVLANCPWLSYESGDEQRLEIGFDEEAAGEVIDCRPALAVICRW